jgi:hypothetical protein
MPDARWLVDSVRRREARTVLVDGNGKKGGRESAHRKIRVRSEAFSL